jgi:hypothetical protein
LGIWILSLTVLPSFFFGLSDGLVESKRNTKLEESDLEPKSKGTIKVNTFYKTSSVMKK